MGIYVRHASHSEVHVESLLGKASPSGSTPEDLAMVSSAAWTEPADVKTMFGANIDFVSDNRIIFDISGNQYRLIVHVAYPYKRLLIKFVGTHKEYDQINPETV